MHKLFLSLFIVFALMTSACGGGDPSPQDTTFDFKITNKYAESLFNLGYSYTDANGQTVKRTVFTQERIAAYRSAVSDEITIPEGITSVTVEFSAVSLGEVRSFDPLTIDLSEKSFSDTHYTLEYQYDLATANFGIRHGWE